MMEDRDNPNTESSDFLAMKGKWETISDIMAGPDAIRKKPGTYLPKYENEDDTGWKLRVKQSPWRPEFEDAVRGICAKPFTRPVKVSGDAPPQIIGTLDEATKARTGGIVDDIDGQGNSLHSFARDLFVWGVAKGLAGIYIAYPDTSEAKTVADEKAINARPYWVLVQPDEVIACYFEMTGGVEVISHLRLRETAKERDGFSEVIKNRVRVIELDDNKSPVWTLYEERKDTSGKLIYVEIDSGSLSGVKGIPFVPFFTGHRFGSYGVTPPLYGLADMQLEIYRSLSRKDEIMTYAGSPMLKGTGMNPPAETTGVNSDGSPRAKSAITVGPKTVLFAPASMDRVQPDWNFIQPDAANIKEVRDDLEASIIEFRRLALQPTLSDSGTMVATPSIIEAAKANSAVQVWAVGLKDALTRAFMFTCQWMKIDAKIVVDVNTDFAAGMVSDASLNALVSLRKNSDISRDAILGEFSRRNILGPEFDCEKNEQDLAEEQQGLEPEIPIDPRTGNPIEDDQEPPPP